MSARVTQENWPSAAIAAAPAPLRIVHVVSSLKPGGMEQFVLRLAAYQRDQGHAASVLALQGGALEGQAQQQQVPVRVLGGAQRAVRVLKGLAHLASRRPQVVHAHNPTSMHYALLGKSILGARVVMTYHGSGRMDGRAATAREWNRLDAVVGVSAGALAQIDHPLAPDRVSIIRNGVEPAAPGRTREEVRKELGLHDRCVGVMVARLDGLKGHDTLLRALLLVKETTAVSILVVGDGAKRESLEVLARSLGVSARVHFLGFRADIPDLLGAADFFALPSLSEGLPLSVLEAMSQRLPVIASAVGGIPELVADGVHGLLLPPNNPEVLAQKVELLAADPCLRRLLGEAGYRRVCKEFSFAAMAAQYDTVYQTLLSR